MFSCCITWKHRKSPHAHTHLLYRYILYNHYHTELYIKPRESLAREILCVAKWASNCLTQCVLWQHTLHDLSSALAMAPPNRPSVVLFYCVGLLLQDSRKRWVSQMCCAGFIWWNVYRGSASLFVMIAVGSIKPPNVNQVTHSVLCT